MIKLYRTRSILWSLAVALVASSLFYGIEAQCPAIDCGVSRCLPSCSNLLSNDVEGLYTIRHADGTKSCVYCSKLASQSGWWYRFGQDSKRSDWNYDKDSTSKSTLTVVSGAETTVMNRLNVSTVRVSTDVRFEIKTDRSVNPSSVTVVLTPSLSAKVIRIPKSNLLLGQCSIQFPSLSGGGYDGSKISCSQSNLNSNCGTGNLPKAGSPVGPLFVREVNIDPKGKDAVGLTMFNEVTWKGSYYYVYVQEPVVRATVAPTTPTVGATTTMASTTHAIVTTAGPTTRAPATTRTPLATTDAITTESPSTAQSSPTTSSPTLLLTTSVPTTVQPSSDSPTPSTQPVLPSTIQTLPATTQSRSTTASASFSTLTPSRRATVAATTESPISTARSVPTTTNPSTTAGSPSTTSPISSTRPPTTESLITPDVESMIDAVIAKEMAKLRPTANQSRSSLQLYALTRVPVVGKSAPGILSKAAKICYRKKDWISLDIANVAQTLRECVHDLPRNKRIASAAAVDVTSVANDLMTAPIDVLDRAQKNAKASTSIINSMEQSLALVSATSFRSVFDRVATEVLFIDKTTTTTGKGITYSHVSKSTWNDSMINNTDVVLVNSSYTRLNDQVVAIQFSKFALNEVLSTKNRSGLTLGIAIYQDDKLFPRGQTSSAYQINSRVISASFPGVTVQNLSNPVRITFEHRDECAEEPQCVYWKKDETSLDGGKWSTDGCKTLWTENGQTQCACDHLTNFALLMNLNGPNRETCLSKPHQIALSLVSYIGCGLSLLGLLLLILTCIIFPKQLRKRPQRVLFNLSLALIGLLVVFLAGIDRVNNDAACKATGVLLHYFLLAGLSWMGIEAFLLYILLVIVFSRTIKLLTLKLCLVGWGVPAVIVAITLGVSTDNYGGSQYCYIRTPALYYSFFGPAALILATNIVLYILIVRAVWTSRRHSVKHQMKENVARARAAFVILTLTGLTWVFGFFSIRELEGHLVFNYLFAIFNGLQGFLIFLFHCVLQKDVRSQWILLVRCKGRHSSERASTMRQFSLEQARRSSNATTQVPMKRSPSKNSASSLQSFMPSENSTTKYSPLDAFRRWKQRMIERRSMKKTKSPTATNAPADILLALHKLEGARVS
ncbi:adhesion G-protein coupled receptor G2-like isoform X2 [Oscarella lobularis]|uniref:adhesion G-protein coupled receptor G2-like isoform X2 n=1 Tax=Oscarella lobularis TaxID=121494 RepID=UPI00331338D1